MDRGAWWAAPWGLKRVGLTEYTHTMFRIEYGITDLMHMSLSNLREMVKDWEAWHATVHGITKSQMLLSN